MTRLALFLPAALAACNPAPLDADGKDSGTETDSGTPDETSDTNLLDTADTVDTGLAISWPTSAADYAFDQGTYLSRVRIPPATGANTCCKDFGTISRNPGTDNALASLNQLLATFQGGGLDLNQELQVVLESGQFVGLLDHRGVPSGDGEYKLGFFLGAFADGTSYAGASNGEGFFELLPSSFEPGSGRPRAIFRRAEKVGARVFAEGGNFQVPLGIQNVVLT
ncbi:MAG: hypothetical protein KC656_24030, partial [Myxococcales bacterium]|nr:hypothetical protein [Myxococcales bacterium]